MHDPFTVDPGFVCSLTSGPSGSKTTQSCRYAAAVGLHRKTLTHDACSLSRGKGRLLIEGVLLLKKTPSEPGL